MLLAVLLDTSGLYDKNCFGRAALRNATQTFICSNITPMLTDHEKDNMLQTSDIPFHKDPKDRRSVLKNMVKQSIPNARDRTGNMNPMKDSCGPLLQCCHASDTA